MRILLIKGEKLKKMDKFGTCDPVLKIEYAGIKIQSTVIKKEQNPHWNEEILVISIFCYIKLQIPVSIPTVNETITLKLYDWEAAGSDEIMGSCSFKIQDILDGKVY